MKILHGLLLTAVAVAIAPPGRSAESEPATFTPPAPGTVLEYKVTIKSNGATRVTWHTHTYLARTSYKWIPVFRVKIDERASAKATPKLLSTYVRRVSDGELIALLTDSGQPSMECEIKVGELMRPLVVGKSWLLKARCRDPRAARAPWVQVAEKRRVVKLERVSVPAGSFMAHHVVAQAAGQNPVSYWVLEKSGILVKSESTKGETGRSHELVRITRP